MITKQPVYNLEAKKTGEVSLSSNVFDVSLNQDLIYQVAVALAGNKRKATAHTKTKGEVRGGGRKPWKQKGTGNARTGSIRNPIFRGGGIVFGPRNKVNYHKKINKKMRQKAFLAVLSSKLRDRELRIIKDFKLEKPNTKKLAVLFDKMKVKGKSVLLISKEKNGDLKKSLKNISKVNFLYSSDISSLDLLNHKFLFADEASIVYFSEKYGKNKENKVKKTK